MKINNYVLFLFLLFFSCGTNDGRTDATVIYFSEENELSLKACRFVRLDTNEKCLIGNINQLEIVDDRIFVLDEFRNKCLLVFDLNGNHIGQVGSRGEGPHEYVMPSSFNIYRNKKLISILDQSQQKILFYDLENFHFISQKHIPFSVCDFNILSEEHNLFYKNIHVSTKNSSHFTVTDTLFRVTNDYVPIEFNNGHLIPPFKNMYTFGDKVRGFVRFRKEIYELYPDKAEVLYELQFKDRSFPPADFLQQEAAIAFNTNYIPALDKSDYISTFNVIENDLTVCVWYYTKGKPYIGLYDKRGKVTHHCSLERFEILSGIYGIREIVGRSNTEMVAMIRPYLLKSKLAEGVNCSDELKRVGEECSDEDNPILVLFN